MPQVSDTQNVHRVSLKLTQMGLRLCPPAATKGTMHTIRAGNHARLVEWLDRKRVRVDLAPGRPLQLAVCYEIRYGRRDRAQGYMDMDAG